ncbi:hypothetical protein HK097_000445 [Rhizophlyctis rosea]|uniref:Uncharacterized protein n=1 Tax=Rhizophlyctis rosea TaxID=64517 RepID=A0AAD5S5L9_9FUNG|nr:hypothetical protein HK097_000445 [Rhizophlyctis rosea]
MLATGDQSIVKGEDVKVVEDPMLTEDEDTTKSLTIKDLLKSEMPEEDDEDEEYKPIDVDDEGSEDEASDHEDDEKADEEDHDMMEELNDIMKDSISLQNQGVLRSGRSVGAYRNSTIMQDFASDDEADEDYQVSEDDSDSDSEDDADEEEADDDAAELSKEEVQDTVVNTAGTFDASEKLLMTPSKVLRHGKQIEPVNREEIGVSDLATRIQELMQQSGQETTLVR